MSTSVTPRQPSVLANFNRRQRRNAARNYFQIHQPWKDPKYAKLPHSQARKLAWADTWASFRWDNLKKTIDTQTINEAFAAQFPREIRPVVLWFLKAYNWIKSKIARG